MVPGEGRPAGLARARRPGGPREDRCRLVEVLATEDADGSATEYAIPRRRPSGSVRAPSPSDPLWASLARLAATVGRVEGEHGILVGEPGNRPRGCPVAHVPAEADQSNTSVVVAGHVVLKLYRRLRAGSPSGAGAARGVDARGLEAGAGPRGGDRLPARRHRQRPRDRHGYVEGSPVGWSPRSQR